MLPSCCSPAYASEMYFVILNQKFNVVASRFIFPIHWKCWEKSLAFEVKSCLVWFYSSETFFGCKTLSSLFICLFVYYFWCIFSVLIIIYIIIIYIFNIIILPSCCSPAYASEMYLVILNQKFNMVASRFIFPIYWKCREKSLAFEVKSCLVWFYFTRVKLFFSDARSYRLCLFVYLFVYILV